MRPHSWLTRPWFEKNYVAIVGDVVITAVGIVFILVGLSMWRGQQPIEGGVLTTGQIVGHRVVRAEDSDGGTSTYRYPIIEFRDQQEALHRFDVELSGFGGDAGDVVQVRYDPMNPSRAQWADQPGKWFWIVFFASGLVALVVEAGILLRRRAVAMGSTKRSLLQRVMGPLGPLQRLPASPGNEGEAEWGYVPVDQVRARRVFWIGFGVVLALNALLFLVILFFKVT